MPRDTGPFKIREQVLVAYTDKHYEAKVTKAEKRGDLWWYHIHYPGWNKKFDEWVEAPGLVKFDPRLVNVKESSVAPEVSADVDQASEDIKHHEGSIPPSQSGQSQHRPPARQKQQEAEKRPKKRAKNSEDAPHASWDSDQSSQMEFELPLRLKQILLCEYESIFRSNQLPALPQKPCVADILSQYVDQSNSEGLDFEQEVADGLQMYFDKSLQHVLLYQEEQDLSKQLSFPDGTLPSSLYGGSHLLRLLVKLPEILPTQTLSAASQDRLQAGLVDFIVFLEDNASHFFHVGMDE